jgi:hypothetical protein
MKSCQEITRMISDGMDRDLDWAAQLGIRAHLLMCGSCSEFARQLQALRAYSRALFNHLHEAADHHED